jgi:hypothetical protein
MVRAGLLDEIADLRRLFVQSGLRMDYTKGILQAIGNTHCRSPLLSIPHIHQLVCESQRVV